MAENFPRTPIEVLNWIEAHIPVWSGIADPSDIGLNAEQIAEITILAANARTAYDGVQSARNASKSATSAWSVAATAAHKNASDLVSAIKAFARTTANPAVYELAQILPPAPPSARPAPPTPTEAAARLASDGVVVLTWKNSEAEGASYGIYRRLNNAGPFELIDIVTGRKKEYRDEGVPVGTTQATYNIVAIRNNQSSLASDATTVYFGVPGEAPATQQTGGQAASA